MNFGFDDDQGALRDAAEKLLAAECSPSVVRAALEDPGAWEGLWRTIVDVGWTGLAVPEVDGGLGRGVVDLVALTEVTGRWVLPAPFVSSAGLAGSVLLAAGGAAGEVLAGIADGIVTTLAVHGPGAAEDDPTAGVIWDGATLRGSKCLVPDGARAATFVVVAAGADGPVLAAVPATAHGVTVRTTHAADPNRPLVELQLDGVAAAAHTVAPNELERGLDAARTVLAAELVGVADRILELSVEHARTRRQFDSPIGAFQAVKHRLADLYVAVERARTLTYDAAMLLDDPTATPAARSRVAAMAKAAASETAVAAHKAGVQVHGAIGITWEHDLHLFGRRARQSALALGDHLHHYRRAAELYLAEAG